ncbi:MAG: SEFIR domain-containing protein [Nitrospiraceae bacterium]
MPPKAFISYSWTSEHHQEQVRLWAEQLVADGVDVVLDLFDLKEGHDKYAFMERMVTDPSVTHVLVICDKTYAEKADARRAGVGTESQIISKEVYDKVDQSKFIPIACEFSEAGEPYLPTFLKSRIWLNFSTSESANDNWERLIRTLHGKPLFEKPTLGRPPAYIRDPSEAPSSPVLSRYNALRQAIMQGKSGLGLYRRDFTEACIQYADALRVRQQPQVASLGEKVLEDCGKLKSIRNYVVDWVLLESEVSPSSEFTDSLLKFLEVLRELKSRPAEVTSWNDGWFEAHALFVHETFLYIVASLIETQAFGILHEVLTSHYLLPESDRRNEQAFDTFDGFYAHSETLQAVLAPEGRRLLSPAAELIKRQADRSDVPFTAVMQAELLVLLMTFLTPDTRWYPGTLHYSSRGREFPLFLRATQHKHFRALATITGIESADRLRQAVKDGQERLQINQWHDFHFGFGATFWGLMNLDKLDTLK